LKCEPPSGLSFLHCAVDFFMVLAAGRVWPGFFSGTFPLFFFFHFYFGVWRPWTRLLFFFITGFWVSWWSFDPSLKAYNSRPLRCWLSFWPLHSSDSVSLPIVGGSKTILAVRTPLPTTTPLLKPRWLKPFPPPLGLAFTPSWVP